MEPDMDRPVGAPEAGVEVADALAPAVDHDPDAGVGPAALRLGHDLPRNHARGAEGIGMRRAGSSGKQRYIKYKTK